MDVSVLKNLSSSGSKKSFVILLLAISLCVVTVNAYRLIQKRYTKDDKCYQTADTLTTTETCPRDEFELNVRQAIKKCNENPPCMGKQPLHYHCIESNGILVEVCAPKELIAGKACAFFEAGLGRVIANFYKQCKNCSELYISTDSWMLTSCIERLEKPITTSAPETTTQKEDDGPITTSAPETTTQKEDDGPITTSAPETTTQKEDDGPRAGNRVGKTGFTVTTFLVVPVVTLLLL
uniref:Uncharacterized protein LOC111099632 n=1 Tax=Crassostrea virginica TaxID=6565 RepID=A0A8B8A6C2_CRAVI|nr:uncharacterized protein LOC111099632 [Crassostrea virginica]XP_022286706.1 uncharacterized protein LOC111099632 [Crassostrea virginica]